MDYVDPTKLFSLNKDAERLLTKIKISSSSFWENTPCWEWQADRNRWNYGHFKYLNRTCLAHRIAYLFFIGDPANLCVLHRCDNPPCINPHHLFLGTFADNAHDRDAKSRANTARGERHGSKTMPERWSRGEKHSQIQKLHARKGEENRSAKLKEEDIHRIFEMFDSGITPTEIARSLNVSLGLISGILKGERWQHLGLGSRKVKNSTYKLTEEDIPLIFDMLKKGAPKTVIAKQFNVTDSLIRCIQKGRAWGHLNLWRESLDSEQPDLQ